MEMIVRLLRNYWPWFLRGTVVTVSIAIIGTAGGFVIGLLAGVIRAIPIHSGGEKGHTPRGIFLKAVNILLSAYIEVFRGTPMMVQAMLIYYGLAEFYGIYLPALTAGLLIITINTGAYMSEIVRGGIQAVDRGQTEAAMAIGMTHWQSMIHVVLPQAIRNIIPATGNELVINLKDSSVLNVISVGELFFATSTVKGVFYRTYESFLIAAAIYLTLTIVSSRLLRMIERRMDS